MIVYVCFFIKFVLFFSLKEEIYNIYLYQFMISGYQLINVINNVEGKLVLLIVSFEIYVCGWDLCFS